MGRRERFRSIVVDGVKFAIPQPLKNWARALNEPLPLAGFLWLPRYVRHWVAYARLATRNRPRLSDSYPCLSEWVRETPFDPHYFFQGAWLARRLGEMRPSQHVDIASSVMAVGIISATVPTIFLDYRPLRASLPGLQTLGGDITRLPFSDGSLVSLSCLHVIEHVGLGRYGDCLDPMGSHRAAFELARVLSPGGRLYLSVPVGRERVCFNAHRVFHPDTVVSMLGGLDLVDFSLVDDTGQLVPKASRKRAAGCEYGCGLFEFTKN